MIKLRTYQTEAVNAIVDYLCENRNGNPVASIGTGLGKSLIMAELIRICYRDWNVRPVMMTHNADLIQQNMSEFLNLEPLAPVGVYSASLRAKQGEAPIVFAGIQSVAREPWKLGKVDMLLIDEVHTIGYNDESQWRKTITELFRINPTMRMVGLSATPYRLGTGMITDAVSDDARDNLFHKIVYEYGLIEGVRDGYLCEPVPKQMAFKYDLTGVHKRGGEYIESELQAAVNKDPLTKAVVSEIVQYGAARKTWMIFCSGVDHCRAVCAEIRSRGVSCEVVTGDTPQAERQAIYARLKSHELTAVCSVAVMTTGTNIPCIDMIAFLRPTESAGLLVQMAGRGTRTVYATGMPLETAEQRLAAIAASDKKNCLILDFAGNLDRHGPLDMIKARKKGSGDGVPPMKVCQNMVADTESRISLMCGTILHISKMICPACGFNFPPPEKETIAPKAANAKVLSTQVITEIYDVQEVNYREHQGKEGKPNTLCVEYRCGLYITIKEWICLNHPAGSWARNKAREWWNERKTIHDMPSSVSAALEAKDLGGVPFRPVDGLNRPLQIEAEKQGNFWRIVRYIYELEESAPAPSTEPTYQRSSIDTDDIPF